MNKQQETYANEKARKIAEKNTTGKTKKVVFNLKILFH